MIRVRTRTTKDLRKFYQFFGIIQHAKTTFEEIENPVFFIIEAMMIRDKIFLLSEIFQKCSNAKNVAEHR